MKNFGFGTIATILLGVFLIFEGFFFPEGGIDDVIIATVGLLIMIVGIRDAMAKKSTNVQM